MLISILLQSNIGTLKKKIFGEENTVFPFIFSGRFDYLKLEQEQQQQQHQGQ